MCLILCSSILAIINTALTIGCFFSPSTQVDFFVTNKDRTTSPIYENLHHVIFHLLYLILAASAVIYFFISLNTSSLDLDHAVGYAYALLILFKNSWALSAPIGFLFYKDPQITFSSFVRHSRRRSIVVLQDQYT